MSGLVDLLRAHTRLGVEDERWLQRLTTDWQIVADLAFADLVLWVRDRAGPGLRAVAQIRPTTAPTAHLEDVVGAIASPARAPGLATALREGRQVPDAEAGVRTDAPARTEAVPVRRAGRVIGVVARTTNLRDVRTPSTLELSYLRTAAELCDMVAEGRFPQLDEPGELPDPPRVGDGFVRVEPSGRVGYASPNAQSVYRRLGLAGDLVGHHLGEITRVLVTPQLRGDEERLGAVLSGRVPADLEIGNGSVTVILRSIPLSRDDVPTGGLLLLRDVSDLRRRDRELISKEATIREIHHRVKNNLQTVAALLRLQSRRIDPPGRAALEEAVRRVGSIALVHETLSHASDEQVAFDVVVDRLRETVIDVGSRGGVRARREGSFGDLRAATATPLAMVLTELLANAVEHGFGAEGQGSIVVRVVAAPGEAPGDGLGGRVLEVAVEDDGVGLPPGFDLDADASLGLSIVRTLVGSELGGGLAVDRRPGGGTTVRLRVPV